MQHPFFSTSPRIFFGADYNPDQWPEAVWQEDMKLMREAGVNVASIAIFSWARLQSAPGVFHFEWLDRLMDLLAENGITANLATPTAAPPAWLVKLHPDILPTRADGVTLWHGSRQHHNPNSSAYRAACAEIVTAMATRYAEHPALGMWHVNNEYACALSADYGDESAAAFRKWLRSRYDNSLETLNDAWGNAFWSQLYYSWDEVIPPRASPSLGNPGRALDWQRFCSDAFLECYQAELKILREITPDIPVTTNFMSGFKPLDYRKWSRHLDFTCLDIYPEPQHSSLPNALNGDLMRSLKDGTPWMIMEQVTTHVNWRQRNATKPPGLMRLWSYQSIAHGADGICFFQWRQARAGAEKFHGAMVGQAEDPRTQRCYREIKELGNELKNLAELGNSRVRAEAAIYFDWENWWALELPSKPNNDLRYIPQIEEFYRPLLEQNITTDLAFEGSDLSRYKVLFVPALYLLKPGVAERVEAYVEAGGHAVFTFFSGIVDEFDRLNLGATPAPLRKLLGLSVEEWAVPHDDTPIPIVVNQVPGLSSIYRAHSWAEVIHLEGAEALASFDSGYYRGGPAITRHKFGKGTAWYLGTQLEPAFYDDLIRIIAAETGLTCPYELPKLVEVIERHGDTASYRFLLNHQTHSVEITDARLAGFDLITQKELKVPIQLPAYGVAILRV